MAKTERFEGELVGRAYAAALVAVLDFLKHLPEADRHSALFDKPQLLDCASELVRKSIADSLAGQNISFLRGRMWADPGELLSGLACGGIDMLAAAIAVDVWLLAFSAVCEVQTRKNEFEEENPRRARVGFPESLARGLVDVPPSAMHRIAMVAVLEVMNFKAGYSGRRVYFKTRGERLAPRERRAEIEAALRAGKSAREIARAMNVSHKQVSRIRQQMPEA